MERVINLNCNQYNMKLFKLKNWGMRREIKKAQKDPAFIADIKKFIKITTGTYKLKDYGLE